LTYSDLFEWIQYHYDLTNFFSVDDLISKVKTDWIIQGLEFPGGDAEDSMRQQFQEYQQSLPYTDPDAYSKLQKNMAQKQLVADMLGSGKIMESLSDEIVESYQKAEIMGVDMTEFRTDKEEVVPPEVKVFEKQSFFSKIASGFKRIFRFGR
jgi:hypothetical protein